MKRYLVKKAFCAETDNGEKEFHPGQTITLSDGAAELLLREGMIKLEGHELDPIWKNPHPPGMSESWRASAEEIMNCVLAGAAQQIQQAGRYDGGAGTKEIEGKITEIYKSVLNSEKTFKDFIEVANAWTATATRTIH
jgi:hypothetical protein